MSGKAAKIVLTEKQHKIVDDITRSKTASLRLIQRCQIILLAFGGAFNATIAEKIGLHRVQVGLWRRRWQESADALIAVEFRETTAELCRVIEDVLGDAPRTGSTGTFSGEQVTHVLAVACEPPELSGRPIVAWTARELADEVIKRGIVESILNSRARFMGFILLIGITPHTRSQVPPIMMHYTSRLGLDRAVADHQHYPTLLHLRRHRLPRLPTPCAGECRRWRCHPRFHRSSLRLRVSPLRSWNRP